MDSSEHLDAVHTERSCSECGGNFPTKKDFDAHTHLKRVTLGETSAIENPAPSQPSSKDIIKNEEISSKYKASLMDNPNGDSERQSGDLTSTTKGQFIFECIECQESFPTQFHLSTHARDSHSIPQCSLPPKKRCSPMKNWSPKSDEKEDSSLPLTPLDAPVEEQILKEDDSNGNSLEIEPKLETNIDSSEQKEDQSPKKRRKKAVDPPLTNESDLQGMPARRNRARKNYTDIDLYLDESEEEAILQKILKQTSRLSRGRKSKNEYAVNNNSVKKSDNESITHESTDSLHKRDSLSTTRGRRRGRCKKI